MATAKRFKSQAGLDGNSQTLTNVADPVNAQDVATKNSSSNASNLTSGTVDPARLSPDLTAIVGIPGASGYLKKLSANTWGLDTSTFLTANQNITITGDGTGSGSTSLTLTLSSVGTAGTYKSVTTDAKGRVTGGTNPTTLTGFGITDAVNSSDVVTTATANKILKLNGSGLLPASVTGNAATATALATGRTISITGDISYTSPSFDGSGNVTAAATLPNIASAGTYRSVTINAKGQVTAGTNPTTVAGYGLTDCYTMTEVDAKVTGLAMKASVRLATTANIASLSGLLTVDGVVTVAGDRVLVKNQTTASTNGIYVVASGAWTRATDADTSAEVPYGMYCMVESGTLANTGWTMITTGAITLGTTALTFTQYNGLAQIAAGAGLVKAGNTISADGNLAAIEAIAATSGLLKKTADNVWTLDTNTYLTANQTITYTGDVTGSGTTSVALTLPNIATAGTFRSVTINAKGQVTGGTNPTTLVGYGITDAATSAQGTAADNALPKSGGTMTGNLVTKTVTETRTSNTNPSVTTTLDCSTGTVFDITLNKNVTLAFSNVPAGTNAFSITVMIRQDSTGGWTVTFPGSCVWSGGISPVVTAVASKMDIVTLMTVNAGTTWYGNIIKNF